MDKSKHPILCQIEPWEKNENTIWLASTVALNRNIDKFKFPGKLQDEKRKQMIGLISEPLLASSFLQKPHLITSEEMLPVEKEFLYEHFLTSRSFNQAHGGEAFIIDHTGCFLAAINLRDHLQLQLTDCYGELENTWNRLLKIETELGAKVSYSFSPRFGFLTSAPAECGTGLTVSLFLQATAMIHMNRLEDFLDRHHDEAIAISGLQGKPGDMIGDLLTIKNNYSLGLTEENILTLLRGYGTKLYVQEKSARSELKQSGDAHIKDMVGRAYGLLTHSYQIETIEALNAISLIKLGVDLGWVTGVTMPVLNSLFFQCRRAHLLCQLGEDAAQQELLHKRAEFIHKVLKDAKLHE